MNQLAGLAGSHLTIEEREKRLRNALSDSANVLVVRHLQDSLSVAWTGHHDVVALSQREGCAVLMFGAAYFSHDSGIRSGARPIAAIANDCMEQIAKFGFSALSLPQGSYIGFFRCGSDRQWHVLGDPGGNRSPYFSTEGGELRVASSARVCALLAPRPALDRRYERFFLSYGFHPFGTTAFSTTDALSATDKLSWPGGETSSKPISSKPEAKPQDGIADPINALYTTLSQCLDEQLNADKDVAVLLGGFDSALVASMLQRAGKRVTTYSFRYGDRLFNQPHVETLSKYLGTRHVWVDIDASVIDHYLTSYGYQFLRPTNWVNYVAQTAHVAEHIRADGIRIAYSGDGCDGLFLGYPGAFQRTRLFAALPHLPQWLTAAAVGAASSATLDKRLGHPYRVAMNMLRATGRPMPYRGFLTFRILDDVSIEALAHSTVPDCDLDAVGLSLAQAADTNDIERLGYLAKGLISPNAIKLSACLDIHGLPVFSPYMHPALRSTVSSMPSKLLRDRNTFSLKDLGKSLLIAMARRHGLLPDTIIYQPKLAAVDSPIDSWFRGELQSSCRSAISNLPFEVNSDYVDWLFRDKLSERLYKKHLGSTRVISDAISLLATYGATCASIRN